MASSGDSQAPAGIKINANIPAGPHYAQYAVEIPLQILKSSSVVNSCSSAHDQISNLVAATICKIHKTTAVNTQIDLHDHPSPPSSYKTSRMHNESQTQAIKDVGFAKISLHDTQTSVQIPYWVRKNERIYEALKDFVGRERISAFKMMYNGVLVETTDTALSVSSTVLEPQ